LLIKKYFGLEGPFDLEEFQELCAQALWLERRETEVIAYAIAKAFSSE